MKEFLDKYPAQLHRIIRRYNRLLRALRDEYEFHRPECPEDEFLERILYKLQSVIPSMMLTEGIDEERLSEFVVDLKDDENRWIYFSCAYAVASECAISAGDLNLAWELQCDAHLQYGLAASTDRGNKILVQNLMNMHLKSIAGDGGNGKAVFYEPYKDAALEILRSKKWKSLDQASITVAEKLKEKFPGALEEKKYASSSVKRWLRELPMKELDKFIPTYRAHKESGQANAKNKKTGKKNR